MSRKKPLPFFPNVEITGIAAEGKAIAKTGDAVIFVPFAVPGDVADLQIVKKKKNYMEAVAVRFEKYAENRRQPFCPHFGICGGCKWQMLPYTEQLKFKQQQVVDNLTRIGKIELPDRNCNALQQKGFLPILGSAQTECYRNKLEFTFSNRRWRTYEEIKENREFDTMNALGFHIPGMFDKVLDIEKCLLQDDIQNRIRNEIRRYAGEHNLAFFDLREHTGFLRTIMIRTATTGEVMLAVVFFYKDEKLQNALMQHLADTFPEITSLLYMINPKANDTFTGCDAVVFGGKEFIIEEMDGLRFKISPKSFFQTNTRQACELYRTVSRFASLTGGELVYDLYTGTGTIANFIARSAGRVIGIEYVSEAIEDAIENSALNRIENVEFYAGDMKDVLNREFIGRHGKPDVIITDPPRAGMHGDVIDAMLLAAPERIVYVSCNPATQARDLSLLNDAYRVTAIQPVDMFPHTHHVENVALLEKR